MSTNTDNNTGLTDTTDSTTVTAQKTTNTYPPNTDRQLSSGSKPNAAITGFNASETASDLNANLNLKPKKTKS